MPTILLAIPVLKTAANSVLEAPGVQNLHETFHKRCDILLKCTTKIKECVLGKSAPDLLDQVRENVRPQQASDQGLLHLSVLWNYPIESNACSDFF